MNLPRLILGLAALTIAFWPLVFDNFANCGASTHEVLVCEALVFIGSLLIGFALRKKLGL